MYLVISDFMSIVCVIICSKQLNLTWEWNVRCKIDHISFQSTKRYFRYGVNLYTASCFFSALIRTLFHRFPFFPYELLLILVGSLLGIGSRYSNEIKEYTAIIRDQPQNVFYIFLPVVAFEVSYFLDYQSVFKAFAQIFILSAPLSGMYIFPHQSSR